MSRPVSARGVTLRRGGATILDGVDASFEPGRLTAVVGPNGAGKSTLLKVVAGDLVPDEGDVWIDSEPVFDLTPAALARLRAVMPQQATISFGFTVREYVEMGLHPHAASLVREEQDHAIEAAIAQVSIGHLAERSILTLSGGELQRATLARVLVQATPVVLLDEPISSLDPAHQHRTLRIASELAAEGRTVMVILHDLTLAARYADEVVVLTGGTVAGCGDPREALDAELLTEVYGCRIHVGELAGRPVVTSW